MSKPIPPQTEHLLSPLLASLPAASVSPEPPAALLPLLSPILRQRVQLLSGASSDPWLPLLCYESSKVPQLEKAVRNERLEPHPVSGEVEVDWESDVHIRYKRVDEETLQALVSLTELLLSVRLVWCINDEVGGGNGWRIGEVSVLDGSESSWGPTSISAAEDAFETTTHVSTQKLSAGTNGDSLYTPEEDEDDDDDYWAQYDKTPSGNTPAPKEDSTRPDPLTSTIPIPTTDEDMYYAQYASVQPAMDNHDPDEAKQNGDIESSLGRDDISRELRSNLSPAHHPELSETSAAWSEPPPYTNGVGGQVDGLVQPRPSSSASSSGSETVERLERHAAGREQSDIGIKQHIGTSIKSLWRLAKVSGIERAEFDRLVKTELDCLSLMDEDD